jgi:hypothetical protein
MSARTHIVDSGGTARLVSRLFVVDSGGTSRLVSRAFVIDSGGTARLIYTGARIVTPFTAYDMLADNTPGATATASLIFGTNGSVASNATIDGGSTTGSASWYSPNTTGIGSSYWIRFTPTSGSFTTNGASSFSQLSSNRQVTKSASTSAGGVTFTIEIASDSGGSNIVMTSTGNILRYQHTL